MDDLVFLAPVETVKQTAVPVVIQVGLEDRGEDGKCSHSKAIERGEHVKEVESRVSPLCNFLTLVENQLVEVRCSI